jgi:hypothetical protein
MEALRGGIAGIERGGGPRPERHPLGWAHCRHGLRQARVGLRQLRIGGGSGHLLLPQIQVAPGEGVEVGRLRHGLLNIAVPKDPCQHAIPQGNIEL